MPFHLPAHTHNDYQLIYVRQGAVHMDIGGKAYEIESPALLFIGNFEQHSIRGLTGEYERIYVNLAPDFIETALQSRELLAIFCNRPAGFSHIVPVKSIQTEVEDILRALKEEYYMQSPYWEEMAGVLLKKLLILIYRISADYFPVTGNGIRDMVWDAKKYIEENFSRPLTILEVAEYFHVSSFYLSHAYKRVTGYSPKQYLMQYRLTMARRLLLTTDEKVSEIALRTGFGDASNFTRTFRETTEMTPLEFRLRGGHMPY